MGSEGDACDECSRNCLLIHRNHVPSQIIPSFFKVMYGKNFSDLLILPPRFIKSNSLVDQETYLENSNGQKWNVVLSTINGSLAIQKGWHEFTLDHGIEVGDFVVFYYIMRSHFVVRIYGRSGCEKLNFGRLKNKRDKTTPDHKRDKTTPDPVVLTPPRDSFFKTLPSKADEKLCAVSQSNGDVTERRNDRNPSRKSDAEMSEVTPRTGFSDDSFFMFGRDTSSPLEDDRAHLFDLSSFERVNTKASGMKRKTNGCPENGANKLPITQANSVDCSKRIKRLSNEENSPPFTNYPSFNNDKPSCPYLPESDIKAASGGGMVDIKKLNQDLCCNPVAETCFNVSSYEAKSSTIPPEVNINTGKVDDFLVKGEDEGKTIMKQEPADICDNDSPSLTIKVTCSVKSDCESFLELPEKLPLKVPRRGVKWEKKLVFLRDQVGRQWPVMYHQKNGVYALTSGWKSYRKTNNIQPGDECTFMVENIDEYIFGVQILRR